MLERVAVVSQSGILPRQGAFEGGLAEQSAAAMAAPALPRVPGLQHSAAHSEHPALQTEAEPGLWHWLRWRKDSRRCYLANLYADDPRIGGETLVRSGSALRECRVFVQLGARMIPREMTQPGRQTRL